MLAVEFLHDDFGPGMAAVDACFGFCVVYLAARAFTSGFNGFGFVF